MKAKDLKNSILQMAVQGKLVPQDPNDEPASVLLERIREERAKLIKEKKIKKPKGGESVIYRASDGSHYEKRGNSEPVCIDDEIPFEIPESWEWCRLETLCSKIGSGSTPSGGRNVYKDKGPLLIRSQNVYDDGLRLDGVAHFDATLYESRKSHVFPKDVLLNITGASIGRCAIVPDEFEDADINQHVLILRQVDQHTREYVHLAITSPAVQEAIMSSQVGATKEGLSATKASELLIPLPPLAEQPRIVEQVDASLDMVAEYGSLEDAREALDTELPDRLRKSVLQQAIQGKLVPQDPNDEPASVLLERIRAERRKLVAAGKAKAPKGGESVIYRGSDGGYYEKRGKGEPACIDDEIPFEIPESWEWTRLGSLCDFGTCVNIEYSSVESGVWNLELEDIERDTGRVLQKKRKVAGEKGSTKHIFKQGMVLYSKLRPYLNKVVIADEDGVCSSEILPLTFEGIIPEYAQTFFMSPMFLSYAESCSYGVKMPRLGTKEGKEALLPVPPLAEQRRITKHLQKVLPAITSR